MKRRDFLKALSASLLVVLESNIPIANGREFKDRNYVELIDYKEEREGDYLLIKMRFRKEGHNDNTKVARISNTKTPEYTSTTDEKIYKIYKTMIHAYRDYLFNEHGDRWREHDDHQREQIGIFCAGLEHLK